MQRSTMTTMQFHYWKETSIMQRLTQIELVGFLAVAMAAGCGAKSGNAMSEAEQQKVAKEQMDKQVQMMRLPQGPPRSADVNGAPVDGAPPSQQQMQSEMQNAMNRMIPASRRGMSGTGTQVPAKQQPPNAGGE